MTRSSLRLFSLTATLLPAGATAQPVYAKAERTLTWNAAPLVVNDIATGPAAGLML